MNFRAIVQAHQERTYRAAWRVLRHRDEALDVTQEAFLALFEHRGSVRASAYAGWLHRVATNRALDRLRKRRPALAEVDVATEPDDALERAEERARVDAALAQLSPRQREVVTMRVVEHMSFVEICAALSISEGAAKVHFRRGVEALRRLLITQGEKHGPA